ncbi:MAG: protein-disulfide reductase DsbD [Gammaproteobacteria bacterium]|nr:protein-disulfide reductase DsbD [Gammaproteobacteria bacterium]
MRLKKVLHLPKSLVLVLLGCLIAQLMVANSFAAKEKPLSTDDAFIFSMEKGAKANEARAIFTIAPGYYLYQDRLKFISTPEAISKVTYPPGQIKQSERKSEEVYVDQVTIPLVFNTDVRSFTLDVLYQGCSKEGFCYPPLRKTVQMNLALQTDAKPLNSFALSGLMTSQYGISELLYTQQLPIIILIFIVLGLLLSLTPCVLPMVPILTSIIVGQKAATPSTKKAFWLSLTYVLGMAITYAFAGIAAALLGNSLQVWLQQPWIILTVSTLFLILAFSLFSRYDLRLPKKLQQGLHRLNSKTAGGHYIGVFIMGMLSALVVSPCVTAPLVGVLIYIGQTGNIVLGGTALFALGIGMGIPLLLIGTSAGRWLPRSGNWMIIVKKLFGFMMLGMAIWMLSRLLSQPVVMLLWGLLFITIALYFSFVLTKPAKWRVMMQTGSGLLAFTGLLFVFGGMGLSQWLPSGGNLGQAQPAPSFRVVQDVGKFKQQLADAIIANKPVILDFYADWCESCITMDKKVFNLPHVQDKLSAYTLLRADITEMSRDQEDLLKFFNVFAPPTILFFDPTGQEINSKRIVGEVSAHEFLTRLKNNS